jgi:hypothetical protein
MASYCSTADDDDNDEEDDNKNYDDNHILIGLVSALNQKKWYLIFLLINKEFYSAILEYLLNQDTQKARLYFNIMLLKEIIQS